MFVFDTKPLRNWWNAASLHDKELYNVHNKYSHKTLMNPIYIGRGSIWGNPYKIDVATGNTRDVVIQLYAEYILKQDHLRPYFTDLIDRPFVCYCFPQFCRGAILREILWQSNLEDRPEDKFEIPPP